MSAKRSCVRGILFASVAAISGCGLATTADGEPDETIDVTEGAWSVDSCASVAANISFSGKVDPEHVSPSTYNTCYKSYVVDIIGLLASYTGVGGGGGPPARITARWADTIPTTKAACEDTEGGILFYQRIDGAWFNLSFNTVSGQWSKDPFGIYRCYLPYAEMSRAPWGGLVAGADYRVAATMRNKSGTNPVRKVAIRTAPEEIIR